MTKPWLVHRSGITVDVGAMGLDEARFDALPWDRVFDEMRELVGGAIANADENRQVGHYWLRAPELAPTLGQAQAIGDAVEAVRDFAAGVRSGKIASEDGRPFTHVLHIGIGGSALGPELVLDALEPTQKGLTVRFLNNTDPDGIHRVLRDLGPNLRHTLIVVVSKSGGTAETRNGMLLATEVVRAAGLEVPSRMVAITGEGSALHKQAIYEKWRATFPMWDWVGGRTSVLSAVGLLTAELAGLDTAAMLSGARAMDEWTEAGPARNNPAALLAGAWHLAGNGKGDRAMVALPYSDRLVLLSKYLQQLVMESIGKGLDRHGNVVEQGLVVYGNKGSTDQHAYVQQLRDGRDDFFATFVQVLEDGRGSRTEVEPGANAGDVLQGFLLGTRRALRESGRPSMTLTVPRVDGTTLGALIALFERAVGLYASLIDVNAYHQPGVEAGKKAAADVLKVARALRDAARVAPGTADELAERLNADPTEAMYVLERLVATGRLGKDGDVPTARYTKAP